MTHGLIYAGWSEHMDCIALGQVTDVVIKGFIRKEVGGVVIGTNPAANLHPITMVMSSASNNTHDVQATDMYIMVKC